MGGPFGEPSANDGARASTPKPSFGTRAAPKKGRDGSSLGEDAFASSDAYTLTYRRRGAAADDRDAEHSTKRQLPEDLAAEVRADDDALEAMMATYAARVREERARIEARRASAREAAEAARAGTLSSGGEALEALSAEAEGFGSGGFGIGEPSAPIAQVAPPASDRPASSTSDDYHWIPAEWIRSFCDDVAAPGPLDVASILCPHGFADPSRASAIKRVSAAAYRILVDASGIADGSPTLRGPGAVCRQCLRVKARAEAATETAESARAALRAAVRETTEEEDATPGRRFSSPPRGYGHGARGRPVRCQAPWVWAPREDSRARTAVCARTRRPSRFPRTRGRDYEPRFRKTATTSVPRMKASVRESPPRTTFRTTTRVDFEPVTSAMTMTTFASSRRSAGQSGGARAPAAPGVPPRPALAPAAAFRALALALARVSRVVLGGVRGMRGGARGDRRGEERTARARRGARRDVRFDASPRGD